MNNRFLHAHSVYTGLESFSRPFETPVEAGVYHTSRPFEEKVTFKDAKSAGATAQWLGGWPVPGLSIPIVLSDSVGRNGKNIASDVDAVRKRLEALGYGVINFDKNMDKLEQMIRFFQAVSGGFRNLNESNDDGRVDKDGNTLKWLNASNAPLWIPLDDGDKDASAGLGYYNFEKSDPSDGDFYYGTNWLVDIIKCAGKKYNDDYLAANPAKPVIWVNDLSLKDGTKKDHTEHQTGLGVDIRLPKNDGSSGGITYNSTDYDRDTARAMIKAFRSCEGTKGIGIKHVFFNDDVLIKEGICSYAKGHNDHIHVGIKSPSLVL